ncbi:Uncharacterised protein [Helicobacter pullorum]|uniref:Uncharacterized protein n=2 Tax=Helicobacter pullorum TaxID=35818 RepID=A0A377Q2B9_9HELI|nr:Uncharacterised protein [Helicobacter pullorum]
MIKVGKMKLNNTKYSGFYKSILLIFSLVLFNNYSMANNVSQKQDSYEDIFIANDAVIDTGTCSFQCRKVSANYGTQITSIDISSGRTFCKVFPIGNYLGALKYEAGTTNNACVKEWQDRISETPAIERQYDVSSTISFVDNDKEITLSRFLSAMVTLDPTVIDREATKVAGNLVMANGITTRGQISGVYDLVGGEKTLIDNITGGLEYVGKGLANIVGFNEKISANPIAGESVKLSDAMTQVNFAYFSNLFESMNEVYVHLQNLLFVVVGMFFLGSIGTKKLQDYFENRGSSGNREPFLHKFYIPLLSFGLFFMPIPEGKNDFEAQATVVQHTIRYFTASANKIADIASAKSAKVYMDKVFNSVGGISNRGEDYYKAEREKNSFILEKGEQLYKETCEMRYPGRARIDVAFSNMTEREFEMLERSDPNQLSGQKGDITLLACMKLEKDIAEARLAKNKAVASLEGIEKYQQNDFISPLLTRVDNFSKEREFELGWFNSSLLPGTAMLLEISTNWGFDSFDDFKIQQNDSLAEITDKNKEAIEDAQERGEISLLDGLDKFSVKAIGWVTGQLIYGVLPGYSAFKAGFESAYDTAEGFIKAIITAFTLKVPALGAFLLGAETLGAAAAKPIIVLMVTAGTMELILEHLPIIIVTVATAIAIVSYLVSLTKYYFISPFVVAFAITTKRMDKIVEFLLTGISLFFKPVLIVLFVYLSLFVYVYVKDFFLLLAELQTQVIRIDDIGIIGVIVMTSLQGLTKILAYLACAYVMFRMVVGGAEWTMKYIGLDRDNDSTIAQSMSQRLEQRAFMGN